MNITKRSSFALGTIEVYIMVCDTPRSLMCSDVHATRHPLNPFFLSVQGFRQDLGFQELGGTIKKTPQKIFFLPAGHRVEKRRVHQV